MLKILGLTTNSQNENDYFRKLISSRNKNSSSKSITSNISSPPKKNLNLSKAANENTAKKKSRRKSLKKNSEDKKINKGYKYIQQKAINYINATNKANRKLNNDINNINNIINITNNNSNKKNKNKNKKNSRIRKSIDEQNTTQIKNLTCDKKIKEIKIKTKFNMSYINLFLNKSTHNQNQSTCTNKERMCTVTNMDKSTEKNKTVIHPIRDGIYKKKLKLFNSLSMEKTAPRSRRRIESIEISFSRPKLFINKFQDITTYENDKEKIIFIQKKFRQFLVKKYKRIFNEKITKGILCLNLMMKRKIFCCCKNIFLYGKNNKVYYVDENQIELLEVLKEKNIYSMIDLKKYIVCLIKNNKLEMF